MALLVLKGVIVLIKEKYICVGSDLWVYGMKWRQLNGCQFGVNLEV